MFQEYPPPFGCQRRHGTPLTDSCRHVGLRTELFLSLKVWWALPAHPRCSDSLSCYPCEAAALFVPGPYRLRHVSRYAPVSQSSVRVTVKRALVTAERHHTCVNTARCVDGMGG